MRWKEWYKDGKVYTFEMNRFLHGHTKTLYADREEQLIAEGYTPVFDRRKLNWMNGRGGSLILENDPTPDASIAEFQHEFMRQFPKSEHQVFTSLDPRHVPIIKKLVMEEPRQVRNILIDSMFKDRDQFRHLIIHLFSHFIDVNVFVKSRGALLEVLKDEVANHMDKYPIRNTYYTYGIKSIPYFNELAFALIKNNVYEIGEKYATMERIKFKSSYEGLTVEHKGTYQWMVGDYSTDDTEITPPEQKSKWA